MPRIIRALLSSMPPREEAVPVVCVCASFLTRFLLSILRNFSPFSHSLNATIAQLGATNRRLPCCGIQELSAHDPTLPVDPHPILYQLHRARRSTLSRLGATNQPVPGPLPRHRAGEVRSEHPARLRLHHGRYVALQEGRGSAADARADAVLPERGIAAVAEPGRIEGGEDGLGDTADLGAALTTAE
jgi:hypothetical protein